MNDNTGDLHPDTTARRPRTESTRSANRARQLSLILSTPARRARAIGMSPTALVQAALPHQEVFLRDEDGEFVYASDGTTKLLANHYTSHNGEYRLNIRAGVDTEGRRAGRSRGIPYGGLARLLLAYIVTEAKTQDTRTVDLGRTLTAFCRRVDITPSGGKNGRIHYLTDQIKRLATCAINWEWDVLRPGRKDLHGENLFIVKSYHFWDQDGRDAREPASGGTIVLSPGFWENVVADVFPIDFRKAQHFRGRPLAYDLYLWLTYRLERMQRTEQSRTVLNYDQLHAQLGSHYQTDRHGTLTRDGKRNFARKVRQALQAVAATWPALRYDTPKGRIVLYNSGPDVEYKPRTQVY